MSKRAFFVIGPEGSGTNMLAEAFVSAGCHYNPAHNSHLDDYEFEKMPDLLVFRRSMPHAGEFPLLGAIVHDMKRAGYEIYPIVIIRDWYCTIQSVLRRDSERLNVLVEDSMRVGLFQIFDEFFVDDLICVSYESFCLHPEFRRWLFVDRLGLKEPTIEIKYANDKYYEEKE